MMYEETHSYISCIFLTTTLAKLAFAKIGGVIGKSSVFFLPEISFRILEKSIF